MVNKAVEDPPEKCAAGVLLLEDFMSGSVNAYQISFRHMLYESVYSSIGHHPIFLRHKNQQRHTQGSCESGTFEYIDGIECIRQPPITHIISCQPRVPGNQPLGAFKPFTI